MATRVLVIEDNHTNLELIVYLLDQHGYEALTAMDGEEGIAVVERENPDIIVCDIQLPKLSGHEIAKKLKNNPKYASIPLIAVTAYSMVGDKDSIMASGFDGYIAKPIDPDNFIKQIESYMKKDQHSNHVFSFPEVSIEKKQITNSRSGFKGTILVVDDSASNRQLFQTVLESEGFKVEVASSIAQALEMLDKSTPGLILSDLHMPNVNGLDFLKIVKRKTKFKDIPFIIISSSDPKESECKESIALGATKFITSPIEPHIFLKKVKEIWELNK